MAGSITTTTNSYSSGITNLVGKAAGIYTKAKSAIDYSKAGNLSLSEFISKLRKYGVLTKSKYEVNFSGIDGISFFITDLSVPSIHRNFGNLHYRGQTVEIPITIEYDHDFSMTVINDAKGKLYSTIVNWLMTVDGDSMIDSGYTMSVRILGDGESSEGLTLMFEGVRFKTVGGITLNSGDSGASTFNLGCSAIKFSVVEGKLTQIAGILGAASDAVSTVAGFLK